MNWFFGFDNYVEQYNMLFNINHFVLVLSVILFVILLALLFSNLSQKGQNIMLVTIAVVLCVLELGRITYAALRHYHGSQTMEGMDWWWHISFQMCAQMTWFTVITVILIYGFKLKKIENFCFYIFFGQAMLGGILSFCYPDLIHNTRSIWHFQNLQTIVTHSLLIAVPVCLLAGKRNVVKFKGVIITYIGLVSSALIAGLASILANNNFMYMRYFDLLEIAFPLNIPVLFVISIVIEGLLYGSFWLVDAVAAKSESKRRIAR